MHDQGPDISARSVGTVTHEIAVAEATETQSIRTRRDRALLRAFVSGAALRLLGPVFGGAALAIGTRGLGDVRFGVVAALASVSALAGFADLGVGLGMMTSLAAADARQDVAQMRRVVSSAWITLLVSGSAIGIGGTVAALLLPWNRMLGAPQVPVAEIRWAVAASFLVVGVAVPAGIGQKVLSALQRGTLVNGWAFAGSVLTPAAVLAATVLRLPLWAFVVAFAGSPVAVAAVQTGWVLGRSHSYLRPVRAMVTLRSIRRLMRLSALFLVMNVAVSVSAQSSAIIVAGVAGAASAAVFAVVLRMFGLLTGLFSGGTQQLWPALVDAFQRGDLPWVRSRFFRVISATAGILGFLCLVLIVVGRPLVRLWAGPSLVPPMSLLIWMAVWTVYGAFISQVSYLLNAADVVAPQTVMAVAAALATVGLSFVLTQRMGLVGPVIGSFVGNLVFNGVPALVLAGRLLRGGPPRAIPDGS
jgi:O-antigen/teichoic acid export membrane protein